jgi:hypothetical protein
MPDKLANRALGLRQAGAPIAAIIDSGGRGSHAWVTLNAGAGIAKGLAAAGAHALGVMGSEFEKHLISQTPLGRFGQPEDIAPAAVFPSSEGFGAESQVRSSSSQAPCARTQHLTSQSFNFSTIEV